MMDVGIGKKGILGKNSFARKKILSSDPKLSIRNCKAVNLV
jgi:hypothetical protein